MDGLLHGIGISISISISINMNHSRKITTDLCTAFSTASASSRAQVLLPHSRAHDSAVSPPYYRGWFFNLFFQSWKGKCSYQGLLIHEILHLCKKSCKLLFSLLVLKMGRAIKNTLNEFFDFRWRGFNTSILLVWDSTSFQQHLHLIGAGQEKKKKNERLLP